MDDVRITQGWNLPTTF